MIKMNKLMYKIWYINKYLHVIIYWLLKITNDIND